MKIKQIPEDFLVEEAFDFTNLEKDGDFSYFKLTKKNYAQMKALDIISDTFNVRRQDLRFAGTKDKIGITKQVISIQGLSKNNIKTKVGYLNEHNEDIQLEYLGQYNRRITLGENLGNKFEIIIRDLSEKEIQEIKGNSMNIEEKGVLNFFDSQRFGFAGNSHLIGLKVLQNDLEGAVQLILASMPKDANEEHKKIVQEIKDNWKKIKEQDVVFIQKIIDMMPNYLRNERNILEHLKKAKNDFPGAFRTIHKKLRTLYLNAYQSYIFNELIKKFPNEEEFPLIISKTEFKTKEITEYVQELLEIDNITLENFKLPSSPEYKFNFHVSRKTRIYPKNFKTEDVKGDELNKDKLKVKVIFELEKGAYATNLIKQLFL